MYLLKQTNSGHNVFVTLSFFFFFFLSFLRIVFWQSSLIECFVFHPCNLSSACKSYSSFSCQASCSETLEQHWQAARPQRDPRQFQVCYNYRSVASQDEGSVRFFFFSFFFSSSILQPFTMHWIEIWYGCLRCCSSHLTFNVSFRPQRLKVQGRTPS